MSLNINNSHGCKLLQKNYFFQILNRIQNSSGVSRRKESNKRTNSAPNIDKLY